jgi:hypothetical protein
VYYDELPRLDALTPKGRVIGGGGARTPTGGAQTWRHVNPQGAV